MKRAVQKALISEKDREWDDQLREILGGYRRRPGTGRKSPFETFLGIRPRFAVDPPQLELVAFNTDLAREFEIAITRSARPS